MKKYTNIALCLMLAASTSISASNNSQNPSPQSSWRNFIFPVATIVAAGACLTTVWTSFVRNIRKAENKTQVSHNVQQVSEHPILPQACHPAAPVLSPESNKLLIFNQQLDRIFDKYRIVNDPHIKNKIKPIFITVMQKDAANAHYSLEELDNYLKQRERALREAGIFHHRVKKENPSAYAKWAQNFSQREPEVYEELASQDR